MSLYRRFGVVFFFAVGISEVSEATTSDPIEGSQSVLASSLSIEP